MGDIDDIRNQTTDAVELLEKTLKKIDLLSGEYNRIVQSGGSDMHKKWQTVEAIKMFRQRYDKRTNLQQATIQLIDYLESIFKDELQ